jgi:hypothetical protein
LNVTEEIQGSSLPTARVATRPGISGIAEHRRRLYQRHLLLFLAVNGGLLALDQLTSPGIQWAHFLAVPWSLVFLAHTTGLKSRGYSFLELFIPPRTPPVKQVYTIPLDYELVRARQLRDGVVSAAAPLREDNSELADSAVKAADDLLAATESMIAAARSEKYRQDKRDEKLVPEAQKSLEALDKLHEELISVEVSEASPESISLERLLERTEALRGLAE